MCCLSAADHIVFRGNENSFVSLGYDCSTERRRVLFLRFLDKIYRMADNVIQQIRQMLDKGG